jgi:proteasome lid subunit RPN8/RPN11
MTKAIGFLDVTTIYLPESCALEALACLYKEGRKHREAVALWAGIREGDSFYVKRTIIPVQSASSFEDGLIYVVKGEELHRISLDLFDSGMQLIAQIHSHPGEAYHSDTDDAYPIVTVAGGISIVVPNFATGGLKLSEWAIYRFIPDRGWTPLSLILKQTLLIIVDDEKPVDDFPKRKPFKFWPWR